MSIAVDAVAMAISEPDPPAPDDAESLHESEAVGQYYTSSHNCTLAQIKWQAQLMGKFRTIDCDMASVQEDEFNNEDYDLPFNQRTFTSINQLTVNSINQVFEMFFSNYQLLNSSPSH